MRIQNSKFKNENLNTSKKEKGPLSQVQEKQSNKSKNVFLSQFLKDTDENTQYKKIVSSW